LFGYKTWPQDKGLMHPHLAVPGSSDFFDSEATAGIEPAMKVLQTFDLSLGLTLRLSSRRAKGAPQSDRPFSLLG